jgi:hypothetical protein
MTKRKEDFKLGDMIIATDGTPAGLYVKEIKGNKLGILLPGLKYRVRKLNLDINQIEGVYLNGGLDK